MSHILTPDIPFTPKSEMPKRNTRPREQLDMRKAAVMRRLKDPRTLYRGKNETVITEDFISAVVENILGGADWKPAIVATGFAHPRTIQYWIAQGYDEFEFRTHGKPCQDCSKVAGHPDGCEKCGFTGVVKYDPPQDVEIDLKVEFFLRVKQAQADLNTRVNKTIAINATQTQYTTKQNLFPDPDNKGEMIVKSETVQEVLPNWQAAVNMRDRTETGQRLAALGRAGKAEESQRRYDEAGVLEFSELVEGKGREGEVDGPVDLTPFLHRYSDGLKVMLAKETMRLIEEDRMVKKSMEERDKDVLVVEQQREIEID